MATTPRIIEELKKILKIQQAMLEERNYMLATKDTIIHNKPLPNVDKDFISELKDAITILELN